MAQALVVYKMLDINLGGLTSLGVFGKHMITYYPQNTHHYPNMFVFESEKAAKEAGITPSMELWECETVTPKPVPSKILESIYVDKFFEAYWKGVNEGEQWPGWLKLLLKTPPPGTLLVNDLYLIRRIA